ncbi:MAG: hypothetical protein AAFP19_16395 [Bacteroidota bacterium]
MKTIFSILFLSLLLAFPSFAQVSLPCDQHEVVISNVATIGLVDQSSTFHYSAFNTAEVRRSIDGITSGNELNITRTNPEMNPWWEIDLTRSNLLESVKIWYPTTHYPNGFNNYYILMSEFPFATKDLRTELSSPFVNHVYVENAVASGLEIPLGYQQARYMRVQVDGPGDITIFEIQVPGGELGEICGNGKDDDCDGMVDCQDTDCRPTIFNVQKADPTCPICDDAWISVQAFGDNLSYSLDGGAHFEHFPPPTQTRLFEDLPEGSYDLVVSNGTCQVAYAQNPIVLKAITGVATGDCGNGDLEDGDFSDWTGGLGDRENLNGDNADGSEAPVIENFDIDFSGPRHQILPATYQDPNVPALQLAPPGGGQYFAKLGNNLGGPESERLTYCFDVDNQNADFFFNYAVVLEASHTDPVINPFFQYRLYDSESGNPIGETVRIIADVNNNFFEFFQPPVGAEIAYRGWTCVEYDLNEYIGRNVCVEFITADCAQIQHFGYAYIDGICNNFEDQVPTVVLADNVCPDEDGNYFLDGSATTGENQYTWTVCEINSSGQTQNCISEDYFNDVGLINIAEFYPNFACGNTYRVSLAASNDCTDPVEVTKDIWVSCFDIDYPDYIFCSNESAVQIAGEVVCDAGCTFQWQPNSPFFIDDFTVRFPNVMGFPQGGGSRIYSVTVTDDNGCTLTDRTEIAKFSVPEVELSYEGVVDYCSYIFEAIVRTTYPLEFLNIELENLTTGQVFTEPEIAYQGDTGTGPFNNIYDVKFTLEGIQFTGETNYEIRVSLDDAFMPDAIRAQDCTASDQVYVGDEEITYSGPLNTLWFSNALTPNGDGVNDEVGVVGYDVCTGCYHAYNATRFRLRIYHRWGGTNLDDDDIIFELDREADVELGFKQRDIKWDGTKDGNVVQNGVYLATLEIGNCEYPFPQTGGTVADGDLNAGNTPFDPNGVRLIKWFVTVLD